MSLGALIRKDFRLVWRRKGQAFSLFAFGATVLLLFSFTARPATELLSLHGGGYLWVALLLATALLVNDSFVPDQEEGALTGLLLLPVPAHRLFFAKALANWLVLLLVGFFLLPILFALYDLPLKDTGGLMAALVLGTAGLVGPGTLYGAMAGIHRSGGIVTPLLLFPLVVPVIIASSQLTSLSLLGDPMGQAKGWGSLLLAFDAIFWSLSGVLFAQVVDD